MSEQELLEQLRRGLHPQVIVLDGMLEGGVHSLMEEIRALHLDPEPALLLTAPAPGARPHTLRCRRWGTARSF